MIATGQHLPEGLLYELPETTLGVCMTQPAALKVSELAAGKNLVIFAVPGALRLPVQPSIYRASFNLQTLSGSAVSMKYGVYR